MKDNARLHSARVTPTVSAAKCRRNPQKACIFFRFESNRAPMGPVRTSIYSGRRHVMNRQEVIEVLREEWDAIPQYRIQRLICSTCRRCQAVLNARGGHIRNIEVCDFSFSP